MSKKAFFTRQVALVGAAALGQVMLLVAVTVVSRRYTTEDLGVYGLFFIFFNISQIVVSLRLEQAIMYSGGLEEINDNLSSAICVIPFTGSTYIILISIYMYFAGISVGNLYYFIGCILISMAAAGISRACTQSIARLDRFDFVAVQNFLRPGFVALFQIALSIGPWQPFNLCISFCIAQVAFAIVSVFFLRRALPIFHFSLKGIPDAIYRNISFIKFSFPQNLIFILSESLISLSLPFLFGKSELALFWLASRTVAAPATVFAESIRAQVYRTVTKDKVVKPRKVLGISTGLGLLMLVPSLFVFMVGEHLFALLFGERLAGASQFALILGLLSTINMAMLPFVGLLPKLNMQQHLLAVEGVAFVVRLAVVFLPSWGSAVGVVAAGSFAYIALMLLFLIFVFLRIAKGVALTRGE